ncbi:diaminopimelate epimerase [Capnocytophaga sp. ARDL2]|uniref:diaminopimelate epimerase n=1 Tax=Capnocytophaga sp. ARDL2 TaxID=3238809 RepID=UPI003558D479
MKIPFCKYQGTGNDFVMIDNRTEFFPKYNRQLIEKMCHRRFGIGADGLILLENDPEYDFKMVYFNSDGNESTMCGNGGRCIVRFAHDLGVISEQTIFNAVDGLHKATVTPETISLQMIDVHEIKAQPEDCWFTNTGSPHHVKIVDNVQNFPIFDYGKQVRYSDLYAPGGTNVNVVSIDENQNISLRTYERGVEDETLSCGTGTTAVALILHHLGKVTDNKVKLEVLGGTLWVSFQLENRVYKNVYLEGAATKVFEGVFK